MDGINSGIDWFFSEVDEGLIIEDDLILHFPILKEAELLFEVFRNDSTIGSIGLRNIVPKANLSEPKASYRYSNWSISAGWGTSSQNWSKNSKTLVGKINHDLFVKIVKIVKMGQAAHIWHNILVDKKYENTNRSKANWDTRWSVTHLENKWTTIVMNNNRIEYNGYGTSATHTKIPNKLHYNLIDIPSDVDGWNHPISKSIDKSADKFILQALGFVSLLREVLALRTRFKSLLKRP